MNLLKQTLFTAALCFILQYFFPWWTMTLGAFAAGWYFGNKPGVSFLAGLLGVGLLWLATATVIDAESQATLTEKVAQLFPTKTKPLLFLLTAVIGGLPGAFAALTGAYLKGSKE
ncbi:MAG: hypothetical protein JST14_02085 [Bacteroidetes bacterium]|nr:hypothetical protein [Bacteroidota bacterium]